MFFVTRKKSFYPFTSFFFKQKKKGNSLEKLFFFI